MRPSPGTREYGGFGRTVLAIGQIARSALEMRLPSNVLQQLT